LVKAHQTLPFMAMVPSDIGFPVMTETEMTSVHSMKGELDVDCSAPGLPALSLKMSHKYASTWSGYVGTVSPFTMELLAAGVSSNRAVNIPVKMEMRMEPATGTVKIDVKHVDDVTPQTTNVDIHHLHIIPVTTKKPLVHVDLTPIAADTANTKVLQSVSHKKRFETRMGERLGLEVKLQVESECDVLDRKTVLDTLSKFNYNPIAFMLLMDTETAQKADGSPTLRYHKYSLIHNPRDSTTKEIKAEIKVSGAMKAGNGQINHHIASQSDKKTKQEEKMTRSIHELDTEEAMAANVLMEVALIGGSPKTYDVSLTAAHGFSHLKNKWNLHLESEKEARMVCMAGLLELPLNTDSTNTLKFNNRVGFGSSCDEHFVLMEAVTATSQKLREQRSNLESAKECEALVRKVREMERHIRTLLNTRKTILEKELGHLKIKNLEKCEERNIQANSLDHVEMDITASPNLPVPVYTVAKYLDAGMKAYLLQYMSNLPTPSHTHEPKVKVVFDFNQRLKSLSMKVISPMDVTQYKNIRLPVWMRAILPATAFKAPMEQLYTRMTGLSLYSKCSILQGQISTFDKMTYRYNLDDCNHLITSDCSKSSNAVLAKEKDNVKHITMFHEDTKIVLSEPLSRYQSPTTPYVILVDGERKEVRPNEVLVFMSKDGMYQYSIHWSKSVIIVDTPAHRVLYNGKDLIVEDKHLVTSPTCGLCGDNNEDKLGDLKSASQCVHRSIQSMAQTYRIQDSECVDNISLRDESILQEEKSLCAPSNLIQPQITSPKHLKNLQPVMKHLFIYHQDSICISKHMIPQCPHQLLAVQDRKQTLEFVCVHAITPQAKAWIQDAQDYKEIPELASMEKEFESTVSVAVSCGMNI